MVHFENEQLQTKKTIKKRSNECSCFIFQYVAFALGEGILEKSRPFSIRRRSIFYPFPNQEGVNCVVKICVHVLRNKK